VEQCAGPQAHEQSHGCTEAHRARGGGVAQQRDRRREREGRHEGHREVVVDLPELREEKARRQQGEQCAGHGPRHEPVEPRSQEGGQCSGRGAEQRREPDRHALHRGLTLGTD